MSRKKLNQPVLAEGEATGHAHRVDVDVYEEEGLRMFAGPTTITHEEHHEVVLPASPTGEWASGQALEYDHFAEEARPVRD